jgi:hypothetical protein
MKTVRYRTVDIYQKVCNWWKAHGFPVLPVDFLPFEGYIISDNDVELYAVFLYVTDSALCWLTFPVSNPKATYEQKQGAMEQLFKDVAEDAKSEGFKFMFTTSPLPRVQEALINSGFELGDQNVNHYMKLI